MGDVVEVLTCDAGIAEIQRPVGKTSFRLPAQIHDHFDEVFQVGLTVERLPNVGRHDAEKKIKIIRDFPAWQFAAPRSRLNFDNLKLC